MLKIFNLKKNLSKLNIIKSKGDSVTKARHYPPATKEWFNSIYAFNKNTLKFLPSADKFVIRFIRGYFNMFSRKLERKIRARRLRLWQRRLSTKRILVSKPELKHTSEKVILNLYVYNRQKVYYLRKMAKLKTIAYLNKHLTIKQTLKLTKLAHKKLAKLLPKYSWKKLFKNPSYFNLKMLVIKTKGLAMLKKITLEKNIFITRLNLKKNNYFNYENKYYKKFLKKLLRKERFYMRFRQIMFLNKSKFNSIYISPLVSLLGAVYNKKVVFNIVTLKDYHLNSDIFTQILAIRIRNRKNRVLRVLKSSLRNVKLPYYNRLDYFSKVPKETFLQNLLVKDLMMVFKQKDKNSDILNNVLLENFPNMMLAIEKPFPLSLLSTKKVKKDKEKKKNPYKVTKIEEEISSISIDHATKKDDFLLQFVLNAIKHKTVSGIRIEAAGRVSRRLIASRAVFKVKHIGTIRNIFSSYKKLPAVILRGNLRSNLQFSKAKNKTRIGAFGLKGWISSV